MFARLKAWLNARRFKRYFVAPYERAAEPIRASHRAGVRALKEAQRQAVRDALRGSR